MQPFASPFIDPDPGHQHSWFAHIGDGLTAFTSLDRYAVHARTHSGDTVLVNILVLMSIHHMYFYNPKATPFHLTFDINLGIRTNLGRDYKNLTGLVLTLDVWH